MTIINHYIIRSAIYVFMVLVFAQCSKLPDFENKEIDNVPPGQVAVIKQENIGGGAIIWYSLPEDDDLLGVIARYSRSGEQDGYVETYASVFTDSIRLEGFPDTNPTTVQLITVDESRNRSEPVDVQITPLTSPLEEIRNSLRVDASFGGVLVNWSNLHRFNIGVFLYAENESTGLPEDLSYFSSAEQGTYIFKGFENKSTRFTIQIKDKWGNLSTPLDTTLTPLQRIKIPSKNANGFLWSQYGFEDGSSRWRGDLSTRGGQNYFTNMFDEVPATFYGGGVNNTPSTYIPGSGSNQLVPLYFTIDLGKTFVISDHRLWHDPGNELAGQNMKSYEIWATNERPKQPSDFPNQLASLAYWTSWSVFGGTDAWKNEGGWIKIAECETKPYSGATAPTNADKVHAAENGFAFDIFPEYTGIPFRYIRVVSVLPMWNGNTNPRIAEFELYGAPFDN
ncbi:DUF4959 domain-containing protein [Sphingobacterium corticibacterium]|uniref:DUF4959 domain-containing protein n=1 Tax=Sphingobacterium corticibacterium TaxID=2484746 RepID=A0A4Q6XLU8_9SPHI|nr:DUF4959 domain-containing protein [Sphingobacterium corticibacterium]RZF58332.1 DUF4959 domain-containing protein [Sphingobacterium corticibacterium]